VSRHTSILAIFSILAGIGPGCTRQSNPYTRPTPRYSVIDANARLDTSVAQLYGKNEFERASPFSGGGLNIHGRGLGALDVVIDLNNLAARHWTQGAYAKAEPLLVQALHLSERTLGAWHPDVATSLNNLAVLYQAQGAYARAEPLVVRALAIDERVWGAMHGNVANSVNNLAVLYQAQGAYAKAEPLYLRALAIQERTLSGTHPDVAISLSNLAFLYWKQAAYTKAEPLYLRALAIQERASRGMHPDVATSLNNLAGLYAAQGLHAKAEQLLSRALGIEERLLGTTHPYVATMLNNLAGIYLARGIYEKALALEARAAEIRELQLRLELARLSESRMRAVMMLLQGETDGVVSLHADSMPTSTQALALALTTVLRRKGRVLDMLADNRLTLRTHLTSALRDKLDQLSAVSTELSNRIYAPFDPQTAASRTSAIADRRKQFEELESMLNEASAELRVQSEPVTIEHIQAAVPRGAALVEFVRYRRFDATQAQPWQEARYVAYILPWQGSPDWVALGEAAPIEAGIEAVLATMQRGAESDAARTALQHLHTLVLGPIRSQTELAHLILSPDGKLNLVPFEALVDPQGYHEVEQRLMSYVTSGRDLLRRTARRAPRSAATLVADPHYGPARVGHGQGTFRRLQGAIAEIAELATYMPRALTLTGEQATKAALAAIAGPAVLHIATHAFYTRDATPAIASTSASQGAASAISMPLGFGTSQGLRGFYVEPAAFFSSRASWLADPSDALDRAGLAMANANVHPDGIVSARELTSHDWWGTQLVVLSACETGTGAVASGEGVYGMRRALVLAGAETQVVSLWSVSDSSTHELMRELYGQLARGVGRAEALRQAKLALLQQRRFAHPYYWAAFIPVGDWTPLARTIFRPQEHR
jgi:CHAT domain-containing protein